MRRELVGKEGKGVEISSEGNWMEEPGAYLNIRILPRFIMTE